MENNKFKKFWNSASDALCNPQETAAILKSFNDVIHGLYFLGSEEKYIFSVLNTTTVGGRIHGLGSRCEKCGIAHS